MRILALETSCDETACAVVENGTRILSSVVASSQDLHIKTGGIIPEVAAREQVKCIIPVIHEALRFYSSSNARSSRPSASNDKSIDALAVTIGPGLVGSLLVGVETAQTLSYVWKKPIVPINHLVGHIYANWIEQSTDNSQQLTKTCLPEFPAVCLVVSGGHTELVLMENHGQLKYLGGTRDDAAGECFDKTARLLDLASYNGGPAIAKAAEQITDNSKQLTVKLPRPMINEDNLDFSFSGLKTAVLREVNHLKTRKQFNHETIAYFAFEIQEAITDVLVAKVIKAAQIYQPKSVLLAGGVAANQRLKEKLLTKIEYSSSEARSSHCVRTVTKGINFFVPSLQLCTDNAAYIASCAFFNYHPVPWQKIRVDPGLTLVYNNYNNKFD